MEGLLPLFGGLFVMLMAIGLYCIIASENVIRIIIGIEILTKGATLALVLAGYLSGRTALAQCLAITLIVVEVAVIAVASGIAVGIFRQNGSLETSELKSLKG